MASVFLRPGSRFWWVKYRDPANGKLTRQSTGIDVVLSDARRRAKRIEAEWTAKEMAAPRSREKERWESWALQYLEDRYVGSGSLKTAKLALVDLLAFFRERDIRTPRQVTHDIACAFVPWRVSNKTLHRISQNTARLRFVYFGVLMSEAVRKGFAEFNPCRGLRIRRDVPKEKEEITPEHQAVIEAALREKPAWMGEQWLVLMRQGCRIAETAVPLSRIDTKAMTITFRIKGGKLHTAQLHPDLLPLIETARHEKRATLIQGPPVGSWSPIWSDFFARRGLPYSIHCARVTVITRLARGGASVLEICNLIGHSEAVNRIYRKLKPADSRRLLDILAGAPSLSTGSAKP